MAIQISDNIASASRTANLDAKFGPYTSKQAVIDELVSDGSNILAVNGLTVGVIENNNVVEYVFKNVPANPTAANVTVNNLFLKQVAVQEETDPTVPAWAKQETKPSYTASEVGAIPSSEKGVAGGVATLGSDGKVPQSQLPSYVDDVLEYSNQSSFPATGESGKIYVALDTNKTYRWSGSAYVEISQSLALGETSSTAFAGDRGKAIEDKIPSNASSSNKMVTASDLNGKVDKVSGATPNNFASFDANGGIKDSGKKAADFAPIAQAVPNPQSGDEGKILGYEAPTEGADPIVGWVQKPQDGKSAYQLYVDGGGTLTQEQWLASLKANIGAFKFVSYDSSAENAFTTGGIGTTYSGTIDSLVAGTDTTPDVILLMNNTDGTTAPTKTFMIATQETATAGIYEFVYAGDLQSAMPSNVLTENRIVNNFTTSSTTDVASANIAKILNERTEAIEDEVMPHTEYRFNDTPESGFEDVVVGTTHYFIGDSGSYLNKWQSGTMLSVWKEVNPGDVYKLEAKTERCRYALLKTNTTPVANTSPDYSDYAQIPVTVENGNSVLITIPNDTHYLWKVTRTDSSTAQQVTLDCYKGEAVEVEGVNAKIAELDENISEIDGRVTILEESSSDMAELKDDIEILNKEINGIHIPAYSENVSEYISPSASLQTSHTLTNPLNAGRKYRIVIDGNSPISTSSVNFKDSEGNAIPFYLDNSTTTRTSYYPNPGGASADVYVVLTKDCVAIGLYVSSASITESGTLTYHITSEAYDKEDRFTKEFLECDKKKRDTTHAEVLKEQIEQDRPYYFDSYFKFVDNAWTQDKAACTSYDNPSYLDERIKSVPLGKHFIFTTDSHIDYFNLFPQQRETQIISYVKNRLGVKNVVFGGDCVGGSFITNNGDYISNNKFIGAKVLSEYADDKFNAFGSDFIYCQGNHDSNSPSALAAARHYRDNSGTEAQQKQALVAGFISSVEVYKRTFRYLEEYKQAVFDTKLLSVIDAFDFTNYTSFKVYYGSTNYYTVDSLTDFGYTLETLKEEFKAWAKMHYYYDDDDQMIRYIVLETFDYGIVARMLATGGYSLLPIELQFVADALLSVKEGYDVVLVGHEFDAENTGGYKYMQYLLNAYKNRSNTSIKLYVSGTSLSANLVSSLIGASCISSVPFDFSNHKGSCRVMMISGHYHYDVGRILYIDTNDSNNVKALLCDPENPTEQSNIPTSGILSIRTDRATAGGQSALSQADLEAMYATSYPDDVKANSNNPGTVVPGRYEQRVGTVNEVLFDVVTITDDNMVYVTRFGGGGSENDRVFTLPMPVE